MALVFILESVGEVQIKREFLRFRERALSAQKLWNRVAKDLRLIEEVQFLTEGGHDSGGWAPLQEATLKAKKRKNYPPWILRASEALFKSLTEEGAEGAIFESFDDFMRFGTSISHASFHQTGTVKMPRRRLIQLSEIERRGIAKQLQLFIRTGEIRALR